MIDIQPMTTLSSNLIGDTNITENENEMIDNPPTSAKAPMKEIFNSADFSKFLSKELPKMEAGAQGMPSRSDSDLFKSQNSFSHIFNSKEWKLPDWAPPSPTRSASNTIPPQMPMPDAITSRERSISSLFSSKDWVNSQLLGNHVDLEGYNNVFGSSDEMSSDPSVVPQNDPLQALPPAKTDWDRMFMTQLQAPPSSPSTEHGENMEDDHQNAEGDKSHQWDGDVPALEEDVPQDTYMPLAPVEPVPEPFYIMSTPLTETNTNIAPISTTTTSSKRKRKRRPRKKILPDRKVYVKPTDVDVLLGRGGRSNHHPGNKKYRDEVRKMQAWYNTMPEKTDKTDLSQMLVDYVQGYGGRFLEKDADNGMWYIVANIVARRKASQALREDNDVEKRRAKRARYLAKKKRLEEAAAKAGNR